jgi:imidazole glycerol-phosphate synthase subunit HisF
MLTKRIIPCLDVKDGKVVKGKYFIDLQWAGDPVAMAKFYEEQGADELVLLDITASIEGRGTFLDVVTQVAKQLSIPLTVGGGIRSLSDIRRLLNAGVDKVSLNTAALKTPQLIRKIAEAFGSQCILLAIDAKKTGSEWKVFSHNGTIPTGKEVLSWALEGQQLGAGELLITSIDRDGTQEGYDLELIQMLSTHLSIPVIASGGVGKWEDIKDVFIKGNADAALAASLFHFNICSIEQLKRLLAKENILVRQCLKAKT